MSSEDFQTSLCILKTHEIHIVLEVIRGVVSDLIMIFYLLAGRGPSSLIRGARVLATDRLDPAVMPDHPYLQVCVTLKNLPPESKIRATLLFE